MKALPLFVAFLYLSLAATHRLAAAEIRVVANDLAAFNAAVAGAKPGDTIFLEAGEWKDAALVFK
ncbi:MAG TPA: hypothetical protein VLE43_16610 [Candidatus Saccharimonadia bacterium]|nr:hypothetical protein [Candidatus Saccharimonadia bacterium]